MKRKYTVEVTVTATVEVDDEVLNEALTPDWQKQFYTMRRREDVVEHLAFNLLQDRSLSSLDGFAHMKDEQATRRHVDWGNWHVREVGA